MTMRLTTLITALLCALCTACAGAALDATATDALPTVAGLDAIKSGSALTTEDVVVFAPLARSHTTEMGSGLAFDAAPADELAWAIYRVPSLNGTLLSATALGNGALYLLAADYGAERWSTPEDFFGGDAELTLNLLGDPVSPDGYIYFAVVCAPGETGLLTALHIAYDSASPTGSTYYVANGGDNGNDGSQLTPWLTLQHAADLVEPGDTVVALPGNYAGFHLQRSGAPGQPITFTGPGATVFTDNENTPDGINLENWDGPPSIAYVVIDDLDVSGVTRTGIRVVGSEDSFAHHITIRGCTLDSNGSWGVLTGHVDDMLVEHNTCSNSGDEHGIYLSNSGDRNIARGNICFGNNACGIQFNADVSLGADGTMSDALVEGNVLYDNGAAGGSALNTDGLRRCVIRNNLIYGNHAGGIVLYNGDGVNSGENLVVNNTIVMPADGRWCINIAAGSTGNRVYNNILWNEHNFRGSITLDASSVTGFESDYNCVMDRLTADDGDNVLTLAQWQTQYGWDTHSIVATPAQLFVDAGSDNYQLSATSPALDSGLLDSAPPFDLNLVLRPQNSGVDLGCFERIP